jgi:Zn-dependent protease
MEVIFSIAVLIFSVVIHEISHGYVAYFLGDPTAKYAGRLSINPIKHSEFIGSILVPFITSLAGFAFGWAKPVPFNPYNLRAKKWGEAIVAIAGPLSNLFIAVVFSLVFRFVDLSLFNEATVYMLSVIVLVNISLAIFNLVPIPPLDGSRILGSLLPYQFRYIQDKLEQNAFILILIFVFFLWDFVAPVVPWLFQIFTGITLG